MNKIILFLTVSGLVFLSSCKKNSVLNSVIEPVPLPESPSNLVAQKIDSFQVTLSWKDNSTNEVGFVVERKNQETWVQIVTVERNVTTYTATSLTPDEVISFRVKSFNTGGNSSLYTNELMIRPPHQPGEGYAYTGTIFRILPTSAEIRDCQVFIDYILPVPLTAGGVIWSTTSNPTIALSTKTVQPIVNNSIGNFNALMSGLTPATTYYVRAYATNSLGTIYSREVTFTTRIAPPPIESVTIGTQVWMVKNLDVDYYRNGDPIYNATDKSNWISSPYYCCPGPIYCYYNNESDTYGKFGKLYDWYALHAQFTEFNIAPVGWHIPSVEEWNTLFSYLGGPAVAGGKMKESGTANWLTPNTGATNSSGFTALPSGSRFGLNNSGDGTFFGFGLNCYYWTSTEIDASNASYVKLDNESTTAVILPFNKYGGCYVRCIKD